MLSSTYYGLSMKAGWGGNGLGIPQVKKQVLSLQPLFSPRPWVIYNYWYSFITIIHDSQNMLCCDIYRQFIFLSMYWLAVKFKLLFNKKEKKGNCRNVTRQNYLSSVGMLLQQYFLQRSRDLNLEIVWARL